MSKVADCEVEACIQYPSNQKQGDDIHRVDKSESMGRLVK